VGPDLAGQPPHALLALGRSLGDCGAQHQALALLRRAQQLSPDDFWLNYELGQQIGRQDSNPADAVRFFAICVALRPRSPLPRLALGAALERAGDADAARAALRHAVALTPETLAVRHDPAQARAQNKGGRVALAALRRGPTVRPNHTRLLNQVGVALLRLGDVDGAVESFFQAVARDPASASAHQNLGDALSSQGRLDEARTAYRRAHAACAQQPPGHRRTSVRQQAEALGSAPIR
jgi:Flp pilus assembly protein TadD